MTSRFVAGVGAWLLGAATATTGSMIAVNQLAHGLLGSQTQQLGGVSATSDLDEGSGGAGATPAAARPSGQPAASPTSAVSPAATGGAAGQAAAGTLLESADGSVLASCEPGGAYLLYWSPAQGFQADDVARGPAAVASVTFRGAVGGVVMRVSCVSGSPVAHVAGLSGVDDDGTTGR